MRDLETMKNPTKRMFDQFLNKFDKYIYDLVKAGYAYSVHGSIKESGFQYSNVMLTDEIKKEYKIDSDYTYVVMQESVGGLITTYLVSKKPTGFQNEMQSKHTEYKTEEIEEK